MNFADRLQTSIDRSKSFIVAGLDPVLETLPACVLKEASDRTDNSEDGVYFALTAFYGLAIKTLHPSIAAVKLNLGFFEQYGLGGMRAFVTLCQIARECSLPVIADAKVGDIGSTARAYSAAFLGKSRFLSGLQSVFDVDALTVNPFLGFDTLAPFIADCREYGKGLFVLVKTSNPGSSAIQDEKLGVDGSSMTVSAKIARWLSENGRELVGECGYSSLGAVVGATYPEEAVELRNLMPDNLFLIPGMGAQGGSASGAVKGFSSRKGGALINLSRGLFSSFSSPDVSRNEIALELEEKVADFNRQIAAALT